MRRLHLLETFGKDASTRRLCLAHCAGDVVQWINDWVWTYDPREDGGFIPFDLWPKQEEYLRWLEERVAARDQFIVEKARDVGLTYLNSAFAVHRWLFVPGVKTTFGANKEDSVDKRGDPDSIFEKVRLILSRLPAWMLPEGFDASKHAVFMRLVNPENGNVITGQVGDNMGRGGRSSIYFVDEAAHIERPEVAEAALSANTDCRGYVSSVNGMGNLFARKRFSGRYPVFTFHWRDDPRKTEAWAKEKKADYEAQGTGFIWSSEYELDYAASVEGICCPAEWVQSAIELGRRGVVLPASWGTAGLDIGGGKAKSVFVAKMGPVVLMPESWGNPDSIDTAHAALGLARANKIRLLNFDAPGVGAGPASVFRRTDDEDLAINAINTGDSPTTRTWPDGRTSKDTFGNLKAELWWLLRTALKASHEHRLWLDGEEDGTEHPVSDLIVLPDHPDLTTQISMPRWFRNEKGKIVLETKKQLTDRGIKSPDFADALVLALLEGVAPDPDGAVIVGTLAGLNADWGDQPSRGGFDPDF